MLLNACVHVFSVQYSSVLFINKFEVSHFLVGGFKPSEKYEFVNWDDCSQYMGKIKVMFQSPPTSFVAATLIPQRWPLDPESTHHLGLGRFPSFISSRIVVTMT